MTGRNKMLRTALVAMVSLAVHGGASATILEPRTERQLVRDADLIFQGTVTRIEYRFSSSTASSKALPHTFVTFSLQSVLKGKLAAGAKTLTLRFLGGPNLKGQYLRALDCPLFDVGDRDVVFVRRNNRNICPVAGWSQGRFRVVGSEIYNDDGREVWLLANRTLAYGEEHSLSVLDHRRGPNNFVSRLRGGDGPEEPPPALPPIAGARLGAAQFLTFIRQLAASPGGTQGAAAAFSDADPDQPFEVPLFARPVAGSATREERR